MATDSFSWKNPRLAARIPELDGIRGLAILLVLIFHYFHNTISGMAPSSWQAYSVAVFRLAWSGVDLFFVLSGFLIGGILYDAKDSKSYYRTFYSRRIYRIFPIYFIWLALFCVVLYWGAPNSASPLHELFNRDLPLWSYPFFLQNISMAIQNTFGPLWMGVTWSLCVEEQFYLLLPLLVRNLSYRGIIWMATASLVCTPLFRLTLWLHGNDYYGLYTLLPSRADALGFGVLVALACRNKTAWDWFAAHRKPLYLALLLLGCGVAIQIKYQRFLYIVGLTWIAAFYATLLLLTLVNPGPIETRFFRSPVLMKLGTVAYAVYIIHLSVNELFHIAIFGRLPIIIDWPSLGVTMLSLITVMLMAALSWRLLEKPLIRHAHATHQY